MRAIIRRLHSEQRGITLVELLVAMLVTSLLLTLVGSFFVSMLKAQRTVSSVNDSTRQGTTSMTQVSRYLREASRVQLTKTTNRAAFESATATSMRFYSGVDLTTSRAGLTKVTIDTQGTKLRMQLQRGDCPANGYCTFSGPTKTIVLADVVRTSGSNSTRFQYIDAGGDSISPTATTMDSIRSVDVTLTVGSATGTTANDTTFQATINLRNLDYGAATES
ncbi:PilW family protein [Curtobacterium aurantiacum]|uniref:PilW family protein n=1 Tax=Curtobacterium aurantiacum TaxID=3236919 RepID=UPI001BDDE9CF|nr:prepilin-type N-terminal cleavage/methylation domain-containing protein [Curtobacterium flaccumfaciens]MBT1679133.1 prepilin-type N-terminal cleavage/methylation domain-containing protein [Curtobacterium flaccumfaciens pv. flaccumfaciens]